MAQPWGLIIMLLMRKCQRPVMIRLLIYIPHFPEQYFRCLYCTTRPKGLQKSKSLCYNLVFDTF